MPVSDLVAAQCSKGPLFSVGIKRKFIFSESHPEHQHLRALGEYLVAIFTFEAAIVCTLAWEQVPLYSMPLSEKTCIGLGCMPLR